jgi:hypothetical protein
MGRFSTSIINKDEITPSDSDNFPLIDDDGNVIARSRWSTIKTALASVFPLSSTMTTDGDLLTRAAGVPARITREELAADPAFGAQFAPAARLVSTSGAGLSGGGSLAADRTITITPSVVVSDPSALSVLDARYALNALNALNASALGGLAWYDFRGSSPDSYWTLGPGGGDAASLPGNSGLSRQTSGQAVKLAVQSRMRRCLLALDGASVTAYLDCDDSSKLAGAWLRIHEGITDPVSPTPGQASTGNVWLRDGVNAWAAGADYVAGQRVIHDGKLWEALVDTSSTPAAGTVDATLDGSVGMVMVEIPRFYVWEAHDPVTGRHAYDVVFSPEHAKPFPNLAADLDASLPTQLVVGGLVYEVHKAFERAGKQRSHRYYAAHRATATDTGNNSTGTLRSLPGDTSSRSISLTNFRSKARNMCTGLSASDPSGVANNVWSLVDFWLYDAMILLQFLEYRSHSNDNTLGAGRVSGADYDLVAGTSKSGNGSGIFDASGDPLTPTAASSPGIVFRGVEFPFSGNWLLVDGVTIELTSVPAAEWWTRNDPAGFADSTSTGFDALGVGANSNNNNWLYARQYDAHPLVATLDGASSSTYLAAGHYYPNTTGWRALLAGGNAGNGAAAGSRGANLNSSAGGAHVLGAALAR